MVVAKDNEGSDYVQLLVGAFVEILESQVVR